VPLGDASVCSEKIAAPVKKSVLCVGISHDSFCGYRATCISCKVFVPPLPRDLADLKARIIAVAKNIDAPMLMRAGKNLNIVSMCAVSPKKKTFSVFLWL